MNETSAKQVWKNLNIWGKSILIVLLIMWFAFSGGIIPAANGDIISMIVLLCFLWLGFVLVAFIVTRATNNSEDSARSY
jgi:hypothetical protein